ncbi:MAG: AsmA family protein [Zoogloeaceae bacterium]|nr:AsmA family protein [Zoogloeaceae bacterium]
MRRKKTWLLAFFLLLFLGGILALRAGFDSEAAKLRLIAEVKARTGRDLLIGQPVRLRFLPRLAVEAGDIRLSGAGPEAGSEVFTLARFSGAIKILPLLRGKIVINRIEMRAPSLHVTRHADGSTSLDDLLALRGEAVDGDMEVQVEKVVLLNGRLLWQDEGAAGSRRLEFDELYLRTGRLGAEARGKLEVGGKLRMGEANHLSLRFESLYALHAERQRLELRQPSLVLKGEGWGYSALRLECSGRRVLGGPASLQLENIVLAGRAERGNAAPEQETESLVAELQLEKAILAEAGELRTLAAQFARTGKAPASLRLDMAAMTGEAGLWKSEALNLAGEGRWSEQEFAARLATSIHIGFSPETSRFLRLDAAQGELRATPGAMFRQATRIGLEGNLEMQPDTQEAKGRLAATLDDSHLSLDWNADARDPPRVRLEARLDHLNLDPYLQAKPASAGQTESGNVGSVVGNASSNNAGTAVNEAPGAWERLEVTGRVRVGALRFHDIFLENLDSRLTLRGGKLELQPQEKAASAGKQKKRRRQRRPSVPAAPAGKK